MNAKDFRLGNNVVWGLLICSVGLVVFGAVCKIEHLAFANYLLIAALTCHLLVWLLILSDIINNNIYNKSFWLLSMFFMPSIAALIYLIRRRQLMQ
jgi:hypothetical protein